MTSSDLDSLLQKALHGDIETLDVPVDDLLPLLRFFNENDVEQLLEKCENQQRNLLTLSQTLILRFVREYFDLKYGSQRDAAATKLQAAGLRYVEKKRFEKYLLATVFEEPSTPKCIGRPAIWLNKSQRGLVPGTTDAEKEMKLSERVRTVKGVCTSVTIITARLRQAGLDSAAAFRCADVDYPSSKGSASLGAFLSFLTTRLRVLRKPGEIDLLIWLFETPGVPKQKYVQTTPPLPALEGDAVPEQEPACNVRSSDRTAARKGLEHRDIGNSVPEAANGWLLNHQQASELDVGFPPLGDVRAAAAFASSPAAKASLVALRDALVALGAVDLCWGRKKPSWRRLVLDAHVTLLREDQARLEQLLDIARRGGESVASQLKSQLAMCGAQLAAMRKPRASPRVAVPVFVARLLLLGKALQLAPVTIHAAAQMASEVNEDRRTARVNANAGSEQLTVFAMPLPAPPQLLHLTALKDKQGVLCTISLENLSENGMLLRVRPPEKRKASDWSANLRLHYSTGTASATIRVGPSGLVEVRFMPLLPSCPRFVHVESFLATRRNEVDAQSTNKSGFSVKRPTSCGFSLAVSASRADARLRVPVWYEAVFAETTVSAAGLQKLEFAKLEELDGDADEDAVELAKILPEPEPLQNHVSLDPDADQTDEEGDADEDEETEADDEEHAERRRVELLQSKMNERLHIRLQQKSSASSALLTRTPYPASAPATGASTSSHPPAVSVPSLADDTVPPALPNSTPSDPAPPLLDTPPLPNPPPTQLVVDIAPVIPVVTQDPANLPPSPAPI